MPEEEQFTVNGLPSPVLAPLGGNLELSCQLSPPQQAMHMEIRWFRNRYSELVYLYRNGKDLLGETIYNFVERTELLKDDIGKGKVILRIFKVTADDGGYYHCFFKDDKFYEEHIIEVKVTATSSDIRILMHPHNTEGVMLECHSRGWFPKPHMEWRDSKGNFIPATSESHSQDENKLFNMTMNLLIKVSSTWNVTCYLQNLLTHQEESISIVLPGELFSWKSVWIMLALLIFIHVIYSYTCWNQQHLLVGSCVQRKPPWKKSAIDIIISLIAITGVMLILHLKQRVPDSDQYVELDTLCLEDISVILCVLIVFNIKLMSLIYFRMYGKYDGNCSYLGDLVHMTKAQMSIMLPLKSFCLSKLNKIHINNCVV
ncbi:selection and upkeep of intraepithelial T-cells protein 2-like [Rattus norvegicus]|uniref:selection and upkeep of intraepithelial T-cells protein 2-like n=1 Tax=Rattus norvegicus TaxID=10116 RepID=UPI0019173F23|nr:selection and upkeep of intraepithelial T-cells protein 2-like [Rattus norvegicus]